MAQAQSEYLIKISLEKGQAVAEINGVKVKLSELDTQMKKNTKTTESSTKANQNFNKANQDLISSSGLAGATLVELGRTISDLPFGITAITNNLSQLVTLFITLGSKTGGVTSAFGLLLKQLNGPLGFILVFQVAISLLQAFQKEIIGVFKGQEKLTKANEELTKSYRDLAKAISEDNEEISKQDEVLEENIEKLKGFRGMIELLAAGRTRESMDEFTQGIYDRFMLVKEAVEEATGAVLDTSGPGFVKALDDLNSISEKTAKSILDAKNNLEAARIKETMTPVEILEEQLRIYIMEQEAIGASREKYINSPEYVKLEAKIEKAKIDAREKAIKENFEARGKQVDQEIELERALLRRRIVEDRLDPVQVAEENLRIYIKMQKALGIKEKEYVQSSEYLDLQTEIAKAQIEARKTAVQSVLKKEGLKGLGVLFTPEETQVMKEARKELEKGKDERLKAFDEFFGDVEPVTAQVKEIEKFRDVLAEVSAGFELLNEAGNMLFEAEISREERKTALMNNNLRDRLKNEKLSAKERENINNQISANEEALAKKRDEIAEKQFKMNKASNIANALINTYLAATGVLAEEKGGAIARIVAAAAIISSGLIQVAAIARQQFVPSAIGGGAGGAGAARPSIEAPDFNVVGASAQSQLAETVAGAEAKPVRAFVVGKDISTQQELDRNITNTASFG